MPKILFIAAHRPGRSPSQRFRFEQYLDYFKQKGFDHELSYLLSASDDKAFYSPGHPFRKLSILLKSAFGRMSDAIKAKKYDIIFIQREAFMTGSVFFEKMLKRSGKKVIFDFDDAIWLLDTSEANKRFEWLKDPGKTSKIIALSDMVIAGNSYLAEYAGKFNDNVRIIPTTIDTEYHKRNGYVKKSDKICIGWTGSLTTIKHFEYAVPVLRRIMEKFGHKITVKVIGDPSYRNEELGIQGVAWDPETEIDELLEMDIGIMPLPDDEWAKGKCGLKGLQYMALELPTIMSPVGVNSEIITDGVNGFLASTEDEWVEKLSALISSAELRSRVGKAARQTVEEKYSVTSQRDKYVQCFMELLKKAN
jgi:glycosyltransferase involved in cell wall biosynthesis